MYPAQGVRRSSPLILSLARQSTRKPLPLAPNLSRPRSELHSLAVAHHRLGHRTGPDLLASTIPPPPTNNGFRNQRMSTQASRQLQQGQAEDRDAQASSQAAPSSSAVAPSSNAQARSSEGAAAADEGSSSKGASSQASNEGGAPKVSARWLYASTSSGWSPFSDADNERLEEGWKYLRSLSPAEQRRIEDEIQAEEAESDEEDDAASVVSEAESGVEMLKNALFGGEEEGEGEAGKGKDDKAKEGKEEEKKMSKKEKERKMMKREMLDPEESEERRKRRGRVEVMEDRLFEVDLRKMECFSAFWKSTLIKVVRAEWFYSSSRDGGYAPIAFDEPLASDLEEAYQKDQPWRRFGDEARKRGKEHEEREKREQEEGEEEARYYELKSMKNLGKVTFDGRCKGRVYSEDFKGRLMSVMGGSMVVRGFDEASRLASQKGGFSFPDVPFPWAGGSSKGDAEELPSDEEPHAEAKQRNQDKSGARRAEGKAGASKRPTSAEGRNHHGELPGGSKGEKEPLLPFAKLVPSSQWLTPKFGWLKSLGLSSSEAKDRVKHGKAEDATREALDGEPGEEGEEERVLPDDRADEPPELVLCIHGIGQKLTEDIEALDFVYDVEKLRNLSQEKQKDAAIREISRGKRTQYLPICWRQDLDFHYRAEGNDNDYSLADITNDAAIPVVRNIVAKVILDVPFYLSRHREAMISAVRKEINRVYRLFVRRNPDFEKRGGRVSLVAHSLGSALAADILSQQPTRVPPLSSLSKEQRESNDALHFNVKNLYLIGSPLPFFLFLDGAQLIARRGTKRTENVAEDAASEKQRYGCLAAESVYNVYNSTDPVAFALGATVSSEYAKLLRPLEIGETVQELLQSLDMPRISISKLFDPVDPFGSAAASAGGSVVQAKEQAQSHIKDMDPGLLEKLGGGGADGKGGSSKTKSGGEKDDKHAKARADAERMRKLDAPHKAKKLGVDIEAIEKAERRFKALNPHGAIDFFFESDMLNEYVSMLMAHTSYWTSPEFAVFVLVNLHLKERTIEEALEEGKHKVQQQLAAEEEEEGQAESESVESDAEVESVEEGKK